ncbi:MAG: hypothetical protein ACRDGJ_00600 [Candidatus Limnocylindria bacterium]
MERPRDTLPEARAAQLEIFRRMRPEERLAIAIELSDEVVRIARAGAASRAPPARPTQPEVAASDHDR